jgi:hypothetical protein
MDPHLAQGPEIEPAQARVTHNSALARIQSFIVWWHNRCMSLILRAQEENERRQ